MTSLLVLIVHFYPLIVLECFTEQI